MQNLNCALNLSVLAFLFFIGQWGLNMSDLLAFLMPQCLPHDTRHDTQLIPPFSKQDTRYRWFELDTQILMSYIFYGEMTGIPHKWNRKRSRTAAIRHYFGGGCAFHFFMILNIVPNMNTPSMAKFALTISSVRVITC